MITAVNVTWKLRYRKYIYIFVNRLNVCRILRPFAAGVHRLIIDFTRQGIIEVPTSFRRDRLI